jgi:hypothetical protein
MPTRFVDLANVAQYGTLDVFASLAAQTRDQTIAQYGEDRVFETIREGFEIHNRLVRQLMSERVQFSTDRLFRYGGDPQSNMQRLDEYGSPDAQRRITGATLGLPLDYFGIAVQWTRKFMQNNTVEDLLKEATAARQAHIRRVRHEILNAIFTPTNNLAYEDVLVDYLNYPVRALLNADGSPIPPNPYTGATFDPNTHTHYLYGTAINDTNVALLIKTVQEHGVDGTLRLEISETDEPAVRALNGFVEAVPVNVEQAYGFSASFTAQGRAQVVNTSDRFIGVYGAANVWVKNWQIPGYMICWDDGSRPIAIRTRKNNPSGWELAVAYENEVFPLRARVLDSEFSAGVLVRHKMAVLYINGAAVAYVKPTIP